MAAGGEGLPLHGRLATRRPILSTGVALQARTARWHAPTTAPSCSKAYIRPSATSATACRMRRPSEIWPQMPRRAAPGRPVSADLVVLLGQTGFAVCTAGVTTSLPSTFWPHAPPNPFPGFHRASLPASGLGAARTTTSCIGRARPRASRQGAASASVRWRAAGRETPSSTLHRQGTHRLCTTSDRRPGPVSPALALLEAWAVSRRGSLSWLPSVSLWEGLCSDSRKRASRRPLVTHARPRNCAPGARVAEQHGRDGRSGRGRVQLARRQVAQHGQKGPLGGVRAEALRSLAPHATRRLRRLA